MFWDECLKWRGQHREERRPGCRGRRNLKRSVDLAAMAALLAGIKSGAYAEPHAVIPSGLPVQVVPTFKEPGAPQFSFPTGSIGNAGSGDGGVNGGGGSDSANNEGSGGSGGDTGGSAYDTMISRPWGSQAEDAATAMGVNASALAGTCMMESGCQNTAASQLSSASGVFQMINSTYQADIAGALALDPPIAGNIVQGLDGKMDPATEAYAAAYELRQDALILQANDIPNPTVLDTRAIYQFGSGRGVDVASADSSANLASIVNLTPAQLAANGLTTSTTVGEWRQSISNKLGSVANQVVLSGS